MTTDRDWTAQAAAAERDMRRWLERAVIGLNLCPFAKAVYVRGQVHFAVSRAKTARALATDLEEQLRALVALDCGTRDTTLLVAPECLPDFLDFNAFLRRADRILVDLGLDGVVQIASFHPQYQFADAPDDDIANFTNRAPHPTLHLLREASVARAVRAVPQAGSIFENNIRTLQELGHGGWAALELARTTLPRSEEDSHGKPDQPPKP